MSRASVGVITPGAVVNEGENLGLMLMRRRTAAILAAVLLAALWSVLLAGTALAEESPEPVRAVVKTAVPEGSPFVVQLIMIVVLIGLGIVYFRLMSHSGRRTPTVKKTGTDKAAKLTKDEGAHAKQASDA